MKKIIILIIYASMFFQGNISFAQLNENFNNATCGGNGAFNNGCVANWSDTQNSPSVAGFGTNPYAWMWSYNSFGEGIVYQSSSFSFVAGQTYNVSFRLRTDDRNSNDPIAQQNGQVFLVATNSAGNITASPTGDIIWNQSIGGNYYQNWQTITTSFTATSNNSQLWIYPFWNASNQNQVEMSIDNIIIQPVPCPFISMVRLLDNSYQNPTGASPNNYADYTEKCIPILDAQQQQINYTSSQNNVYIAFYMDRNNDGDFNDTGEQLFNSFITGNSVSTVPGGIVGGELIRIIVSNSPITGPNDIPTCGEMEDYVLCGCKPDDVTITANGTDITETLTYTIPCGERCVTINASNITDAVYNTSDPVLTNLQGLFCVPEGSTLESFTAEIKGIDSCGNDYYQRVLVKIEQDCCKDKPYIEPYWDFCDSYDVCKLDNWPVYVLGTDGTPLSLVDNYTFLWSDGSTSNALFGVVVSQSVWVEVTYPNGCVYKIYYQEDCCNDVITVEYLECPTTNILSELQRELRNYNERTSVVSREELVRAIDSYRVSESTSRNVSDASGTSVSVKEECDPCEKGGVHVRVLVNGSPITNFDSITITDDSTGITYNINTNLWFLVHVDTSYTIHVVITDEFGHTCKYDYTFEYDCTPDCDVTAPTNLHIIGTTLFWDPVPGAVSYIVSSPSHITWCHCTNQISLAPIHTNQALLALSQSLASKCFAWQVTAICADGTHSPTSTSICFTGGGKDGEVKEKLNEVSITPNPTRGQMTFNIAVNVDTEVIVEVYDTYGTLIKSFVKEVVSDKTSSFSWDGSRLRKGIYFVNFRTKEQTIHKQVIIK